MKKPNAAEWLMAAVQVMDSECDLRRAVINSIQNEIYNIAEDLGEDPVAIAGALVIRVAEAVQEHRSEAKADNKFVAVLTVSAKEAANA